MGVDTAERRFHEVLFQRKMEQWEIEREILRLERLFRKIDKQGDVSGRFDVQDDLGLMYNRLMKIQRTKNKYK